MLPDLHTGAQRCVLSAGPQGIHSVHKQILADLTLERNRSNRSSREMDGGDRKQDT